MFLGLVASLVLVADALTKWWAEVTLAKLTLEDPSIVLIDDVLTFTLAYNHGGAFGMFAAFAYWLMSHWGLDVLSARHRIGPVSLPAVMP